MLPIQSRGSMSTGNLWVNQSFQRDVQMTQSGGMTPKLPPRPSFGHTHASNFDINTDLKTTQALGGTKNAFWMESSQRRSGTPQAYNHNFNFSKHVPRQRLDPTDMYEKQLNTQVENNWMRE